MQICADYAPSAAVSAAMADRPSETPPAPSVIALTPREPRRASVARWRTGDDLAGEQTMGWRDLAQSFAQDAAEMPIVSRLLAGQALLALGYAGLRGALALRERSSAGGLPTLALSGLTVAFAWGALALVSRTRSAPAITAFFAYGHALRQYFPPRSPLKEAA